MDASNNLAAATRRHFLASGALGMGGLAVAWLLDQQQAAASPAKPELGPRRFDVAAKATQHQPQATAMISLWMQGGPSHLDLFDPKPQMEKWNGAK